MHLYGAGLQNQIGVNGYAAVLCGGYSNTLYGSTAVIVGGLSNSMGGGATYGSITCGWHITVNSQFSSITNGYYNYVGAFPETTVRSSAAVITKFR